MRITASKKDDILKRKAKYEADKAAYDERQRGYSKAYRAAEKEILEPIRQYLEKKLSRYSDLSFEISVERGWGLFEENGVNVRIRCNERNANRDNVALKWSYDAKVDEDGEIVRETSSWSGLNATTEEQMRSLRQTVSALDFLNDLDWEDLIKVKMPDYYDYYDENDKAPTREDWDQQLQDAEFEEGIGTDKWFKVANWGETCPFYGPVYVKIIKDSGSQYTVLPVSTWTMEDYTKGNLDKDKLENSSYPRRVRKSSLRLLQNDDNPIVEVQ